MTRAVAAILVCVALAGCAGLRPPGVRPGRGGDAAALLAQLERDAAERRSLRASVRIAIDGAGGSTRSSVLLVVEAPDRLRVEILGFLNQAAAVLVTDGRDFELFRTEDRSLQRGPVYAGLLWEVARIDLAPDEAVAVLLGVPTPAPGLRLADSAGIEGGGTRLVFVDSLGATRQRFDFDEDGNLARVETLDVGGRPRSEISFADPRPVGDTIFSHHVRLAFHDAETTASLEFKDVEIDPTLPAGTFALRMAAGDAPTDSAR